MAARPHGFGLTADAKREMGAKYDTKQGQTSTIQLGSPEALFQPEFGRKISTSNSQISF